MTNRWRGAAILLVAPAVVLVAGSSGSADSARAIGSDPAVRLSALAGPGVTQSFAGGPMPPLGEVPNQAHTASSTYRLLPVTLPGPDSSNQSARVRDEGAAR
jgi:hypothetical protein